MQVPALGSPTAPVASFEFPSTQYCTDDQVTEWIGEEVPTLTYMSMHVPDDHDHSVAMAPGPGPMAMGVMDAPVPAMHAHTVPAAVPAAVPAHAHHWYVPS
jgi:hypothetical protein